MAILETDRSTFEEKAQEVRDASGEGADRQGDDESTETERAEK